jgi:hypothetical protein
VLSNMNVIAIEFPLVLAAASVLDGEAAAL